MMFSSIVGSSLSSIICIFSSKTPEETLPKWTHFLFYVSSLCLPFASQPFIVSEKLMGTWSTISIFQIIHAVMPTLPNLTVNSFTVPHSSLFLSTTEVERLRKLRSRLAWGNWDLDLVVFIGGWPRNQHWVKILILLFPESNGLFLKYSLSIQG